LGAVEALRHQLFGQREADGVGEALAQRPGGGFDAAGDEVFRMPRGAVAELAEVLQLFQRQVVAGQVQQRVLQHRTMPVGQHEAVAVEPLRVARIVVQVVVPQHFGDVGHAHGHAGMAGVGRLDGVHGEDADGIGEVAAAGAGHGVSGGWDGGRSRHCPTPCPPSLPRGSPSDRSSGASASPFDTIAAMPRSPVTLTVVRHMSRKWFTPRIRPMPSGGTPTIAQSSATTGSEPAGTPAVPMPPRMQTSITMNCWPRVRSTPKNCARKITVTPSNSAVPYWLAVAPMVSTKRETFDGRCSSSSATFSAVGSVALLDAVEKA